MLIQNKILIIFTIKCLFCSAILADTSKECDVIQFAFTEPGGKPIFHNFTEQHFKENEQPIYYSFHGESPNQDQTIIFWNNEDKAWTGQTRIFDSKKPNGFVRVFKFVSYWKHLRSPHGEFWKWQTADIVIESRWCLIFDNKCIGERNEKITYDDKDYPVKSIGECRFPFKHENKEYNSCTMADSDGLWCATSVDTNLNWQTFGFCTETCPFEGMCFF